MTIAQSQQAAYQTAATCCFCFAAPQSSPLICCARWEQPASRSKPRARRAHRAPPRRSTESIFRRRRRSSAATSTCRPASRSRTGPPQVVPPKGAPNVLLIMTDDQGYGVSGTFGGVIPTPAMDRIAQDGPALHAVPLHGAVLADAGGADHRPQSPLGGLRHHLGASPPAIPATTASSDRRTPPSARS